MRVPQYFKARVFGFIVVIGWLMACQSTLPANNQKDEALLKQADNKVLPAAYLEQASKDVLMLLKDNDLTGLTAYIHPQKGLIFVPYGYIDTAHHMHFTISSWELFLKDTTKTMQWGRFDGSGDPISLNWNDYYQRFIYDVDFLNAPEFSLNQLTSKSSSPNNIDSIFPGSRFTESHFPGVDPQYGGIDWKALRLVFIAENNKFYLVAVVHDQWTI